MKKASLFAVCALLSTMLFISTSCNKIKDAIAANTGPLALTQQNIPITIPASSSTADQSAWGTIYFDLDSAIQKESGVSTLSYAKMAKSIIVTSMTASVLNGDAGNNFSNVTFSPASFPVFVFNTTPNNNTATIIGGTASQSPLSDPYNWNVPVTGNKDLLSVINGKTWGYGFYYKLQKATTKDLQLNLTVNYTINFN